MSVRKQQANTLDKPYGPAMKQVAKFENMNSSKLSKIKMLLKSRWLKQKAYLALSL